MKNLVILGSTGSIGINTLDVVATHSDKFKVVGLTAKSNITLLEKQIRKYLPKYAGVALEADAEALKKRVKDLDVKIYYGVDGMVDIATDATADTVVSSIVGAAGLLPTIAAIEAGKHVALANKETLVAAGEFIYKKGWGVGKITPVDSEHSAIFQSLNGENRKDIKKLILTASGGPFRKLSYEQLKKVTPADALKHPNWAMGKKITIDSATLMNKGLEVIEAKWLFDVEVNQIDVVIHPQSIIHSLVEFIDGSVIAQLGVPDMRIPISYALTYPERLKSKVKPLNLVEVGNLTFDRPDTERFPSLRLAFDAIKIGKTMPAVLNASNEIAVESFLNGKILFTDIPEIIEWVMSKHTPVDTNNLSDILDADTWGRDMTMERVKKQETGKLNKKSECNHLSVNA